MQNVQTPLAHRRDARLDEPQRFVEPIIERGTRRGRHAVDQVIQRNQRRAQLGNRPEQVILGQKRAGVPLFEDRQPAPDDVEPDPHGLQCRGIAIGAEVHQGVLQPDQFAMGLGRRPDVVLAEQTLDPCRRGTERGQAEAHAQRKGDQNADQRDASRRHDPLQRR